ncbi:DUF5129 domain-containing protein [Ornithinimicrobium avium]|nr:DUF5129 domain-containing protein [Ornithinimicrobium avium]
MSVRQRVVLGTLATLGVAGGSVGWYAASAPDQTATGLEVVDTADVLYEPDLQAAVQDLRFHEPTEVAVYTHRGGADALTNDHALNNAVRDYALEQGDWVSADGQKFADGLFLFAVDPEGRLVGTYFGEDRKVSTDSQQKIQEAAKPDFRAGQWTAGTVAGIEEAASRINAPAVRRGGGVVGLSVASLATLFGAGGWVGVGAVRAGRSRRARADGDRRMAEVVADYEVTELHARLIPEGSRYGGLMLRRYDEYRSGFRELTDLGNQARAVDEKDYDRKETLRVLTAYRDKAVAMDELDDVIADTAAFLNHDRAWLEAWQRQVEPIRTDLDQVEEMLAELPKELRGLPEAQEVRTYASGVRTELDRLRGALEDRSVSPDDALDRLRTTRDDLGGRLYALGRTVAQEFGEDAAEQQAMERAMSEQRSQRRSEPTIISYSYPAWTWFDVGSFRTGFSSGRSDVEASRSSGGGSTSGYSGGGSFSGAGSSSRF